MLIMTIYLSVLSVWMIISPRTIFALCRVTMLSIKLVLMSGYRLAGIIVLLVEQRYVQENLFYNAYLSHDCFPSRLGCDWHRQLHILISYIKKSVFFVILFHELKNLLLAYWPFVFTVLLITHLSLLILVPVVCFVSHFYRFSSPLASSQIIYRLPTTQHSFDLFLQFVIFLHTLWSTTS